MTTIEIIKQSAKDCKIHAKPLGIVMLLAGVPLFWLKCQQDVFYPLSFSRLFLWPLGQLMGYEDYLLSWNLSHFTDSLLPILLDHFLIPLFVFLPVLAILRQPTAFRLRDCLQTWLHNAGRVLLLGVFFTLARIAAVGVFIGLRHLFVLSSALTGILTVLTLTALVAALPYWFFLTGFSIIASVERELPAYRAVRYCTCLLSKHITRITWGYFKLAFLFGIPLTYITLVYHDKFSINSFDTAMAFALPFYIAAFGILYPIRLKSLTSYLTSLIHG